MRHVDPGGRVFAMRVLTREKCKPCTIPGFLLKEMSQIPSKYDVDNATEQQLLQRRVLVDNSPVSCVLHPHGSVLVRDWLGEGTDDDELPRVQRLLEAVLEDDGESEADYAARLVQHLQHDVTCPMQTHVNVEMVTVSRACVLTLRPYFGVVHTWYAPMSQHVNQTNNSCKASAWNLYRQVSISRAHDQLRTSGKRRVRLPESQVGSM
ncbi:unnamed protein product [Symbiodinium pilosum]|uniref:FCP1 homology domain-containing protein n=1 Tax=Symbiodinium pilosum TaxID=2952 RepID=A0A812VYF9_SYMPI|nr:unnamed protein product [Symbiodinium pilosum]